MIKTKLTFNPGPSQLYFTVEDHLRKALKDGVTSISHRSKEFIAIHQSCTDGLRELLGIPDDFGIYFTGSATEIWERIIQNLVEHTSTHLVCGDFSQRFFEIANELGKNSTKIGKAAGLGFSKEDLQFDEHTELIAITHNETSTGVAFETELIRHLRDTHHEAIIAVDAVSSVPYVDFDYRTVDTVYFSVQKGFGLPAGLGVWIANGRCLQKANQLKAKGLNIGSYHSLPTLHKYYEKHQTPETPNVLGIYLLARVVEDMLRRGIKTIRKETEYKSAVMYGLFDRLKKISAGVKHHPHRSKTVIVAQTDAYTNELYDLLARKGFIAGQGYGLRKASQLRFANFPALSKERFETLADHIAEWDTK